MEAMNDLKIGYILNGENFQFETRVEAFNDLKHATRALQLDLVAKILAVEPWVIDRKNVREESIGGVIVSRVGMGTVLDDAKSYVVIGTPKDNDGEPRIAFTGSYDEAADYAERNESPDNYERYAIGEVVGS